MKTKKLTATRTFDESDIWVLMGYRKENAVNDLIHSLPISEDAVKITAKASEDGKSITLTAECSVIILPENEKQDVNDIIDSGLDQLDIGDAW